MRRAIAVAAVLATGCFSVPPYEPETRVSYTEAGSGGTAAGPGFALHFADGDGFHFPDALMLDGTDVMGHDPAQACFDEDEVGFRISPISRISANGAAMPVMNHLTPVLRGPAVVQLKLDWTTRFGCEGTRIPGGTSTFTAFPDGRIVRHDKLFDSSSTPISPGPCSCGATDQLFKISTFWTLARDRFQSLYIPDQGSMPIPLPPSGVDPMASNSTTVCIDGGAYQVAFAWRISEGTTVHSHDTTFGFGRDLNLHMDDTMLAAFSFEDSSAIFIGHAGCPAALARADVYAESSPMAEPLLSIDGVVTSPSALDGIYGGEGGTAPPGIVLATERTELMGVVNSSFAVWLQFPRPVDALRATREGAKGPWYLPQQVDDRSWIVWFPDSISAGEKITIEAM